MSPRSPQEPDPRIVEQFEKAQQAFDRGDSAYVISVMRVLVESNPRQLAFRQLLRAAQGQRMGPRKSGIRRFLGELSMKTLASLAKKNPERALTVAEDLLCEDPHLPAGHRLLGESALALDYPEVAIFAFEDWRRYEPYQLQSHLSLIKVLIRQAHYRAAIDACEEGLRLFPAASELNDCLKTASVQLALEAKEKAAGEAAGTPAGMESGAGSPPQERLPFHRGLNLSPSARQFPSS